jgi:hypothetical protein
VRRISLIAVAAAAALAVPAAAGADTYNGTDCSYTSDEQAHQAVGPAVVYADANGGGGMTGTATASGGVCANGLGLPGADGGTLEAGTGAPGSYVILDGDNNNSDPTGQGDGYFGLSTYETGAKGTCSGGGSGSNSGGCFGVDQVGSVPGVPIACGNTSGNTWNATTRDGCSIP